MQGSLTRATTLAGVWPASVVRSFPERGSCNGEPVVAAVELYASNARR
jgi:hypothetical protein